MTHTWIVGVDGSDNTRHALQWSVQQAIGRETSSSRRWPRGCPTSIPERSGHGLMNPVDLGGDLARMVEQLIAEVSRPECGSRLASSRARPRTSSSKPAAVPT